MAKVYLARLADGADAEAQAKAVGKVLAATGFLGKLAAEDMVAVKLHVGEKNNQTHVKPELAAAIVKLLKKAGAQAFLTDTSTLYKGQRENAIKHALHAHAHGFGIEATGAPFLPLDGLAGTQEREVEIAGALNKTVKIAAELFLADALVVLTHATGHMGTGLGAALKNVGMGLSSRAGKMRQHSTIQPSVKKKDCQNCGKCRKWCPVDAIAEQEGASFIIAEKCIGCGECIAVCRYNAVKYNYRIESVTLQKSMVEHAAGALIPFGAKAVFVTALTDMTGNCDCLDSRQKKLIPDLGILASADIVAADQSVLDLTAARHGQNLARLAFSQLDPAVQLAHAEKLGLGSRKYEIIEV